METKTKQDMNTLDMVHSITDYWTGFLRNPNSFQFDNGDTTKNGAIAMMLANIGKPKSYPEKEIEKFEELMIKQLLINKPKFIDIDYHTCEFLSNIADATLTTWSDMNTFPVKTDMVINWEALEVSVSQGYQAPDKVIHQYYPISVEKLWNIILDWKKDNYPDTPTAWGCEKALERCYAGQYPVEIAKRYCSQIYTTN